MQGLPYDCTAEQVIDFFKGKQKENMPSIDVMDGEDGVLFVKRPDGRATGDAFVLFQTEECATEALLKHKEVIGTRYIELFRSTPTEVQQIIERSMEIQKPEQLSLNIHSTLNATPAGIYAGATRPVHLPIVPAILKPHTVISNSRKDCIRLRGLPYEAGIPHILEFLGNFAKGILLHGIHMVYSSQGYPSGEAFIQMNSESSARITATERHNKYMQIGKKQRYIEVFPCSADDMNLVLASPSNIQMSPVPASHVSVLPSQPRQLMTPGTHLLPVQMLPFSTPQQDGIPANGIPVVSHHSNQSAHFLGAFQQSESAAEPTICHNGTTQLMPAGMVPSVHDVMIPGASDSRTPFAQSQQIPSGPVFGTPTLAFNWPYHYQPVMATDHYAHQLPSSSCCYQTSHHVPGIILMRGIPSHSTVMDVLTFFRGYELLEECAQLLLKPDGRPTGDAYVVFASRWDAERAVIERNHQVINGSPVELFLCT